MQWIASSPPVPRDGCAENLLRFGIDKHFHEAFGLAFFDGAALTLVMGRVPMRSRLSGFANLAFRKANATERWIGVERVAENAVGDAAGIVIEKVGGDDLVVVIGGVG